MRMPDGDVWDVGEAHWIRGTLIDEAILGK